jgi:hypothetical protein
MMNLFSFEVIYKKGDEMPADFLSRNAVDAINFDLSTYAREQKKDDLLRSLRLYLLNKVLPGNNQLAQLIYKMSQDCFVLDGVIWKRLGANQQHRSILLVPQHFIPEILHEALAWHQIQLFCHLHLMAFCIPTRRQITLMDF